MKKSRNQEEANEENKKGRGRKDGGSYGPGGYCVCEKCGYKILHQQSVKCTTIKCPVCGTAMIREEIIMEHNKNI